MLESLVLINLQIKKETLAPVKFAKFLSSLFFKEKLLATVKNALLKKLFSKMSQNSQENRSSVAGAFL